MTRAEAISFGEDRADLFGGKMEEFIKISLEALREQRKGYWKKEFIKGIIDDRIMYRCSECGRIIGGKENFCPKCGSDNRDMRGVEA